MRTDYHDQSFDAFVYDKNGALKEAENQYVKVKLERDKAGQITKEWQDYDWASNEYDETGNHIRTTSRFGADIRMEHNAMGQVTELAAYRDNKQRWSAQMAYNRLGQETRRLVSGGVCSSFEYDQTGRPTSHAVGPQDGPRGGGEYRRRQYEWGINFQLKRITDKLSGGGVAYSYDSFGSLIGSKADQFEELFRVTDEVGNLYEREDRSDRIYGAGSRLEKSAIRKGQGTEYQPGGQDGVSKGTRFFYDKEGNLTKKVEANGNQWFYAYYGNGMLKKVVKPNRSGVYFIYDPLGRRIEKAVSGAGSEKELPKGGETSLEDTPWVQVGGGYIRKPVKKKQDSNLDAGAESSLYAEESREPKTQ